MIRVGPAGWSYPDWEGIVYPRHKPRGFHPLPHLARYVDCVELNSSFYRAPDPRHAARWVELVRDRPAFRFLAKLQNVFTHEPLPARATELRALVQAYVEGIEPLRASGRLAGLLVQFPVSFRATEHARTRLEQIAEQFDQAPLVLEVRHRSWFEHEWQATVEALGYSVACIDLPSAADHPPREFAGAGPVGYLRVHGRNRDAWFDPRAGRDQRYDYLYTATEIAQLADIARRLASRTDETYVIANNHFAGKAMANALELLAALGPATPLAPVELVDTYPRLRELTRPDGQQTLFP